MVNESIENILLIVVSSIVTLILSMPLRQSYSNRVTKNKFLKTMKIKLQASISYFESRTDDYSRRGELAEQLAEDKVYLDEMYKTGDLTNCSPEYQTLFNWSISQLDDRLDVIVKDVVRLGYLINMYKAFVKNIDNELLPFYKKWYDKWKNKYGISRLVDPQKWKILKYGTIFVLISVILNIIVILLLK